MGAKELLANIPANLVSRFWSKARVVASPNLCWVWRTGTNPNFYPYFKIGAETIGAHVFAYIWANGPIPPTFEVDHQCRNRRCVNPNHLRAVPPRINRIENSSSFVATHALKSHCDHGHELIGDNVRYRISNTGGISRRCRECSRRELRKGKHANRHRK